VHKGIQSQLSFKGRKLQRSDLMRQSLKQQAMRINASLLDCKFLKRHWAEQEGRGREAFVLAPGDVCHTAPTSRRQGIAVIFPHGHMMTC